MTGENQSPAGGRTAADKGRDPVHLPRLLSTAVPRLCTAFALLALIAAPIVPPAAAGEPGSVPFLQVRIDRVTPEVVTT